MALLIDIDGVADCHCTKHLEALAKAAAENRSGDARTIWTPHDNPFIATHVEEVTRRFQAVLIRLQDALSRALTGEPLTDLAKSETPWLRWSAEGFTEARERLESRPPSEYTLDDWMLLIDYLVQRYLPDGIIGAEAEYLAVRAQILGKIEAVLSARGKPNTLPPATLGDISDLVPTEFAAVSPKILTPTERSIMRVAKARAADNIGDITASARHRMKQIVIEHVQATILGQKEGRPEAMRSRLFDEFGQLNRDFRRIAITEAGECANSGFIATMAPGARVKRMEAYQGACEFCEGINGKVFTVVSPDAADKDGDTQVWLGKNNIGRSASPRMREGGILVERPKDEMWWVAAGVQHPHCRGSWLAVRDTPANVNPEFEAWMDNLIAKATS